jgi:dTMP kinase
MSNLGKLFVFEGPDCVGKSTLSKWFAKTLRNRGLSSVIWSSFPGNEKGSIGNLVYKLHHNPASFGVETIHPISLQLLHVAAHIDAIESRFAKCIHDGTTVVLDRFWWSTWVYGRLDGADRTTLDKMITLEKRTWGKIKPTKIFLITRRSSESSARCKRLNQLYTQLTRKEAHFAPVKHVPNDGVLEVAQKQILSSLL